MKMQKYIIAGGNLTLLAWECPFKCKKRIIKTFLGEVEQVGFVTVKNKIPKLQMMGNELCINSTLALASSLNRNGVFYTSGTANSVQYQNKIGMTTIILDLPYERKDCLIVFSGIGFIVSQQKPVALKSFLKKQCVKYNIPAFGLALFTLNRLTPYVYVKGTNSLFKETTCGSGSIATSIVTGYQDIIQPTGEVISVKQNQSKFTITAKVGKIGSPL